jgi:hypothetical protein
MFISLFSFAFLMACTTDPDGRDDLEDRFHEKSFSWDSDTRAFAKGSAAAELSTLKTTFYDTGELARAVQGLEEKLADPAYTESLWKPLDYSCDELELALWNAYGTIYLNDSLVFNEATLKSRCRKSEEISTSRPDSVPYLAKRTDWRWWPEGQASDRQYPYKMIGRSWHDFNILVYKSTGGETQFEKHRSRYGITSWYDTDATRIGVRVYLIDCTSTNPRQCVVHHSQSSWYKNDDYVSEREAVAGAKVRAYIPTADNNWTPDIKAVDYNYIRNFKIAAASYSLHSVDHAGLQFRATSSSGIGDAPVAPGKIASFDYVTW